MSHNLATVTSAQAGEWGPVTPGVPQGLLSAGTGDTLPRPSVHCPRALAPREALSSGEMPKGSPVSAITEESRTFSEALLFRPYGLLCRHHPGLKKGREPRALVPTPMVITAGARHLLVLTFPRFSLPCLEN